MIRAEGRPRLRALSGCFSLGLLTLVPFLIAGRRGDIVCPLANRLPSVLELDELQEHRHRCGLGFHEKLPPSPSPPHAACHFQSLDWSSYQQKSITHRPPPEPSVAVHVCLLVSWIRPGQCYRSHSQAGGSRSSALINYRMPGQYGFYARRHVHTQDLGFVESTSLASGLSAHSLDACSILNGAILQGIQCFVAFLNLLVFPGCWQLISNPPWAIADKAVPRLENAAERRRPPHWLANISSRGCADSGVMLLAPLPPAQDGMSARTSVASFAKL